MSNIPGDRWKRMGDSLKGKNLLTPSPYPLSPIQGFTTSSEGQNENPVSFFASAGGEKPRRGFTLVETLVAIAVLMIAISGPFYALSSALNASYTARDQLIATTLAQEGLEYVRSVRDDNYLRNTQSPGSRNWLTYFDGSAGGANCFTGACTVDPYQGTATACNGTCSALNTTNAYLYTQGAGTPTPYTRSVQLTQVNDGVGDTTREVKVTVTVSWTFHGAHSVVINGYLQNWL